ncbi:myb family transcription factor PHL4-like isoform X3 [Ananas comosus]|uniref:Myb family transcription factor PHL4-like isoform X3 n=1 Tax=Ananas comosus TaxID=4615 RepID=A0A6P5ELE5_ANACO|nr:myb family transcription factor PHL4-like isoform X3 [Ananas comosus]
MHLFKSFTLAIQKSLLHHFFGEGNCNPSSTFLPMSWEKIETLYPLNGEVNDCIYIPPPNSLHMEFPLTGIASNDNRQSHGELILDQSHNQSFLSELYHGFQPTPEDQTIYSKMSNLNYGSSIDSQGSACNSFVTTSQARNNKRKGYDVIGKNSDLSIQQLRRVDLDAWIYGSGAGKVHTNNSTQFRGAVTNKQRIRWTQELHEEFVKAVDGLGGPIKATPKGILGLMKSEGLTVFHIKSHLQKYRMAKCTPDLLEGNRARRTSNDGSPESSLRGYGEFHILETLRMQMDVQRSLHEHLEMRIEENADYLQRMFDQQKRRCASFQNQNSARAIDQFFAEFSPERELSNYDYGIEGKYQEP